MERQYWADLKAWQHSAGRKPLIIRGARQIGKTYGVRQFASECFENIVEINFEQQKEYLACFDTLYPKQIINRIQVLSNQSINPAKTLLFFDEIQDCPNAILALRYFYEQMPNLHVIAAGSLLEFTLRKKNFKMPVGRVQSLYTYPLSFKEYLSAAGEKSLLEYLEKVTIKEGVDSVFHDRLIEILREYWVLGGMPEVVSAYLNRHDLKECQMIQSAILDAYRNDFGKYGDQKNIQLLQLLYDKAPGMLGQHFRYVDIDPDTQSRDIKPVVADLADAGIINKIKATSASGLPLISGINERKFKLLFLDIGLMGQTSGLAADILMQKDLMLINRGKSAEQFVGQELLAYSENYRKENLFYWERGKGTSTAEVDYVKNIGSTIIPIEVKAGVTGSLRSLQVFLNEKNLDLGVRISQRPLHLEKRVLSIPFYLISELERLVNI